MSEKEAKMILNDSYKEWDDLSKKEKDRDTVSRVEPWEVEDFANSHGCSKQTVLDGIKAVGNRREDLEKWINANR